MASVKFVVPISAQDWAREKSQGGGYSVAPESSPFAGMSEINIPVGAPVFAAEAGYLKLEPKDGIAFITLKSEDGSRIWVYNNVNITSGTEINMQPGQQIGTVGQTSMVNIEDKPFVPILRIGVLLPPDNMGDAVAFIRNAISGGDAQFATGFAELTRGMQVNGENTPQDPDNPNVPARVLPDGTMIPQVNTPGPMAINKKAAVAIVAGVIGLGTIIGVAVAISKRKKGK